MILVHLLRQPAILGSHGGEPLVQERIDGKVGIADRMPRPFLPYLQGAAEITEREGAGLAHDLDEKAVVGDGAHAPATVIPSMRAVGESVPARKTKSSAGVSIWNMSLRLPAMVSSLTG